MSGRLRILIILYNFAPLKATRFKESCVQELVEQFLDRLYLL